MNHQKKFAAFDIDGTLIRWQLYHAAVDRLAKADLLGEGVYEKIKSARLAWKKRENDESFKNYEKEIIVGFESALGKLSTKDFDKIANQVIEEYKDQVYTYTRNLIARLKNEGYFLLAISGSHHELVEPIAKFYGFDDYIGSSYYRSGNKYSGQYTIASSDKQTELNKMIAKHDLTIKDSYAIGDSRGDIAMLEMVENPIAFNPNKALYEAALEKKWHIVIERKDVIYDLKIGDNNLYHLAI